MGEHSLYEMLEIIGGPRGEMKTPSEMAAMLKPWLLNLCEPTPCPDNAPLMLRFIADAPCWNRFAYSDPVMRQLSAAHYVLRAAESLTADSWTELEDLNASLFLISQGKEILRDIQNSLPLPANP